MHLFMQDMIFLFKIQVQYTQYHQTQDLIPIFIGIDGIWFAVNAAEGAAVIVTLIFIIKLRNRYQYV